MARPGSGVEFPTCPAEPRIRSCQPGRLPHRVDPHRRQHYLRTHPTVSLTRLPATNSVAEARAGVTNLVSRVALLPGAASQSRGALIHAGPHEYFRILDVVTLLTLQSGLPRSVTQKPVVASCSAERRCINLKHRRMPIGAVVLDVEPVTSRLKPSLSASAAPVISDRGWTVVTCRRSACRNHDGRHARYRNYCEIFHPHLTTHSA